MPWFAQPARVALGLVLSGCALQASALEKADHVHLSMTLVIAPSTPRPAGDMLGLYAVEVLACQDDKVAAALSPRQSLLAWLDRATNVLMSSAQANHRDHFDRAGARIVPTRLPLNRQGRYKLGEVTLPQARYCSVRLTLTSLPAVTQPAPLPNLASSVRLTRPNGLPALELPYVVALELPLAKPWQANHGTAAMTLTLDPSAANDLLADASLSEGALVRLLRARWAARSKLVLTSPHQAG